MTTQNIIIQPVVSEKSFKQSEVGVYHFRVARNATKKQIKTAVEERFKVSVTKINTSNVRGRKVQDWKTRRTGYRSDYKKAVVTLKSGQTIDIFK